MRVLYTSPVLEHPATGGPQLRVENSIKALSTKCELDVLSRSQAPLDVRARTAEFVRPYCREFLGASRLQGRTPGAEASIQKIMGDEHGQHVMEFAKQLAGAGGMLAGSGPAGALPGGSMSGPTEINFPRGIASAFPDVDPIWHYGYLFAPALTIGGGMFAVQRNIVAELVLGLPREVDVERGLSWAETRRRPAD